MVRRGLKTTVIATVMAMMLAPSFSAFAQTGKSNTSGSWQVENNAWVFRNAEGQSVKGWVVYNQEWYYLNPENGQLKTGWLQLDGKWYFLSTESGAQQGRLLTGWQWIDGYCYYLMPTDDNNYGVLVVNGRTPDGYYVNQSGQWLHGENGDAVYEAGKGLPSAASSQQVAGASRALPGQVLGASRAIAAPGGGSFGGGGGGGSIGGGATVSTTGGAGTATAGTATSGTSTGTATGGSAAGTTGTAGESTTAGEASGASTGTESNASTGAESNTSENTTQPGGTTENSGTENGGNNAEKPGETVTPGTSENTTQPGGTTENSGTENGGNTTEKPGTENGGNITEKPGETETPGNSENTTQPGGTTEEKPGTENGGNNAEKPSETVTPGNSENTTQPGGTTEEKPGTENGGNNAEKPSETVTPGNSENTTQPGGTTEEKPGTENGGNNAEKPVEPGTPGNSENTTQPGGTTEEKPGTETGGNTEENPGAETGENVEEDKKEEGLAWPSKSTIAYDSDKKCFVLAFEKDSNLDEINQFLQNDIKIFVTNPENKTTEYSLGNPNQNLMRAGNIFCHDLIGEEKKSYRFNALNISRAAFEAGDNKVQIQVEGYASKEYICQVSKQQLEDGIAGLKDFGEVETKIDDDVRTGVYRVKLVSFRNLTKAQQESLKNLKTLFVDDIEYHEVNTETLQDLCQIGPPSFMSWTKGNDFYFAIGNPPKEMGSHSITIQPEEYKDIKLSYVQKEKKLVKAPEVLELKLNAGKKYYQLSFKGDDRVSKYSYLNGIKSFVVAGQTYTRMGSFHPELLNMGAKYILDDSTNAKAFEDILLFSVPTANADKKQEIRIESEGYELNTIPLS